MCVCVRAHARVCVCVCVMEYDLCVEIKFEKGASDINSLLYTTDCICIN